jgi:hypothetical protein
MSRLKKMAPWLNLGAGLLWILVALRDIYMPDFLSISLPPHADKASRAPVYLIVGVLWLVDGLVGMFHVRRNPEGKTGPAITTIFDPR